MAQPASAQPLRAMHPTAQPLASLLAAQALTTAAVCAVASVGISAVANVLHSPLFFVRDVVLSLHPAACLLLVFSASVILLATRSSIVVVHRTRASSAPATLFARIRLVELVGNIAFALFVMCVFAWCGFVDIPLQNRASREPNNAFLFVLLFTIVIAIAYSIRSLGSDNRTVIFPTINKTMYYRIKGDFLASMLDTIRFSAIVLCIFFVVYSYIGPFFFMHYAKIISYFTGIPAFKVSVARNVVTNRSVIGNVISNFSRFTVPSTVMLVSDVTARTLIACFRIAVIVIGQLESIKIIISNFNAMPLTSGTIPIKTLVEFLDGTYNPFLTYRAYYYLFLKTAHDPSYKSRIYSEIDVEPSSWELVGGSCLRLMDRTSGDVRAAVAKACGNPNVASSRTPSTSDSSQELEEKRAVGRLPNVQRVESLGGRKSSLIDDNKSTFSGALSNLFDVLDTYAERYLYGGSQTKASNVTSSDVDRASKPAAIPSVLQRAGNPSTLRQRNAKPTTPSTKRESNATSKPTSMILSRVMNAVGLSKYAVMPVTRSAPVNIKYVLETTLKDDQLVRWAIQSLTSLVVSAPVVDRYGIVSRDVPTIVETYLKLLIELENLLELVPAEMRRPDSVPTAKVRATSYFVVTTSKPHSAQNDGIAKLYSLLNILQMSLHQISVIFYDYWPDIRISAEYARRLQRFIDIKE